MKIRKTITHFSDCDDDTPRGEYTGHESDDAQSLMAFANDTYTCGDFFVAYDDTGKAEKTGQGPYFLYNLTDSPDA